MIDYIRQLKHRPEAHRKNILLVSTSVLTGLAVLMWAFMLPYELGTHKNAVVQAKPSSSPFSIIKKNFKDMVHQVATGISGLKGSASVYKSQEEAPTLDATKSSDGTYVLTPEESN